METSKQKEERQRRVNRRRQVAETLELGKENQEDGARDLFQEIDLTADVETQTNQTETSDAVTQVSCISEPPITSSPNVCYVPVVSRWSQAALGLQLKGMMRVLSSTLP